jgi:hypothetical protein
MAVPACCNREIECTGVLLVPDVSIYSIPPPLNWGVYRQDFLGLKSGYYSQLSSTCVQLKETTLTYPPDF